jgi:tetratricopeptide (TPR) repeat protein
MSTKAESPIIKEGSYAGLGACAESEGKYQEAIENYEKAIALAKMPGSKNRYQYFQGLCYEKLGDKEKAGKLYKEIITENASEFVNYAKGGLTRIGMIIE